MRILLPFNSKYFLSRYRDQDLLNKIESDVIPGIIERHSLSKYVKKIDIFSNLDFSDMETFSEKVRYINNETYTGENFVNLIENYSVSSEVNSNEIIAYHNPLFPFVSVEKTFEAFQLVEKDPDCIINAELGLMVDTDNYQHFDIGAVSVFRLKTLIKAKKRISMCKEQINLTALEMLCLRSNADLDHYNLVINSGFKL